MAKKVNFNISKVGNIGNHNGNIGNHNGNVNNNSNLCKDFHLQAANFGTGGFVVPKTYQLNMNTNQRL